MDVERGREIEIVPIEGLLPRLADLERRFGLPAVSAREELLASGHHRPRSALADASTLDALLHGPVVPGAFDRDAPPVVDSASLRGSTIGDRLRVALAPDYRAYPLY
jgi:hypothetical protein